MTVFKHENSRRRFLQSSALALSGAALTPWQAFAQADKEVRFPVSLHQYSLKKLFDAGQLDVYRYAAFAKNTLGVTNIEFAVEFCNDLLQSPEKADAIRETSKQLGVRHRVLLCGADSPLDVESAPARAEAVKEHLKWARVAERLGCESMRVRASSEGDRKQQLSHASAGIGALCEALESSPVSVLVENIAGFSRDPDWLVEVVEQVGPQRLGLIADFANFDGDIYAGMKRLMPYTRSVCTKSWEFDEAGNETMIDFQRMMKIITDSGFRGCIAIEYLGTEPVSGIQKTAALVRRYS